MCCVVVGGGGEKGAIKFRPSKFSNLDQNQPLVPFANLDNQTRLIGLLLLLFAIEYWQREERQPPQLTRGGQQR